MEGDSMNTYLEKALEEIKAKNLNEPEFIQAVKEVYTTVEKIIDKNPEFENRQCLKE